MNEPEMNDFFSSIELQQLTMNAKSYIVNSACDFCCNASRTIIRKPSVSIKRFLTIAEILWPSLTSYSLTVL